MNTNDLNKLIEVYGTRQENWPDDRREAALALISSDDSARTLVARQAALDRALDLVTVQPDIKRIETAIMAQLPQPAGGSLLDWLIDYLLPASSSPVAIFRPALAAMLPLLLGIVLGSNISIDNTDMTYSPEEEILLLSLADSETESLP
ncbi:MAG: hypothetical protein ACFHX7_19465 [Pseudomonadota bacterium]